ncbi:MAG: thioredoxin domain-containing protein [Deltaproteobacteria bacterium]|nr:thioredoxin domain-containing protein [Deltaproteobacteria bacterium]
MSLQKSITLTLLVALAPACDAEPNALAGAKTSSLEEPVPGGDGEDVYFEGPAHAPVTIVVAIDYQCPYCRRHEETLERLRASFPREVRIGIKHMPLPFHPHARAAALAVEAAREQGRFSEMSHLVMSRQGQISPESLEAWAGELGLDLRRFEADLDSPTLAARVDAHAKSAQEAGGKGTPSTWINGKLIIGAQPYEDLERALHEALGRPAPRTSNEAAEPNRGCIPGDVTCKPKGC